MIIKPELVKRIKEYFNLNIYETKVWLALLSKGIASAGEVAELSGVPRSRTYDVLESLEKRGFAITKIGKPVKYISVKPTEVIEKIKSNALHEANEKVKSLSSLKETPEYAELAQLHNSGILPIKSSEIAGSLRGRSNILSRMRELLENAKKEAVICTSAMDFEDKGRVLAQVIEKLNKTDVKLKIVLSGDSEKIKKLNAKYNIKAKSINSNARVFMIDRKEVLFMVTPETAEEEIGVWLDSPFFTDSLSTIIDNSLRAERL
ncbi:MAG TPA: helix-turn-helix domain-containing protein [Candidatus Nanoarchaeia archaeon]|nr:helix-turn-helix domain-containing protein [Candidatus Nanoarchaeia archaeon]